jgi:hypothetical protein
MYDKLKKQLCDGVTPEIAESMLDEICDLKDRISELESKLEKYEPLEGSDETV